MIRSICLASLFLIVALIQRCPIAHADDVGIRAPDGFEVTLFADDWLAHDIYSMTINARGQVVVAGRDYVKTLLDTDGNGQADKAVLFSNVPASGAHGMYFSGDDLICTGDNKLMRLVDKNGDGRADGAGDIWAKMKSPEHGTNGITQGPDGSFYVICGNDAGVSTDHVKTDQSPVRYPRCGTLVRFSPDGKRSEVIAHGFRNPYDLAINSSGHTFTVDADGERDEYMPWYSPTRLFDIAPGMYHGWVLEGWQRSWNRPAAFFDSMDRLVEVGRGSPTGVTAYRHRQFPAHYRDSIMSCCWTLGHVYHFPLRSTGAGYESKREIFLSTTGDTGFAPVDLAVGPEGDLFVAIGGRGTRGSVFRVRYTDADATNAATKTTQLSEVLSAPQPLSSWSRARWIPLAKKLGPLAMQDAVANTRLATNERIRALEILVELFDGVPMATIAKLGADDQADLFARAAWALGRKPQKQSGQSFLARLTHHTDGHVRRAAWESLARLKVTDLTIKSANWSALAFGTERRVRAAAIRVASRLSEKQYASLAVDRKDWRHELGDLRVLQRKLTEESAPKNTRVMGTAEFVSALKVFRAADSLAAKLEAIRLMQLAIGDIRIEPTEPQIYAGYVAIDLGRIDRNVRDEGASVLAATFPTGDLPLDRELARLLGMLGVKNKRLLVSLSTRWSATSRVEDDIHLLVVMSLVPGERTEQVTQRTARAIAQLHHKMAAGKMSPSRNWPDRVGETFAQLCMRDPDLARTIVADRDFRLPAHAMFASRLKGPAKKEAARRLLHAAQQQDEYHWTVEMVNLAANLEANEYLPILRQQWESPGLRDPITLLLAQHPDPQDRFRYLEALSSSQPQIVLRAAQTLARWKQADSVDEIATVVGLLKQYSDSKHYPAGRYGEVRQSLAQLLRLWTGETLAIIEPGSADPKVTYAPWFTWFAKSYPDRAKELSAANAEWQPRLKNIDWLSGNEKRGETAFAARSCIRCHAGNGRLGPDLRGIVGRMSRDDLIRAIVDPNAEVSPAYYTRRYVTNSGKVYHGLVVYDSPASTLLQTGMDTNIRIAATDVAETSTSPVSLMPVGLLNGASNQEMADLYAYLKTLSR